MCLKLCIIHNHGTFLTPLSLFASFFKDCDMESIHFHPTFSPLLAKFSRAE